MARSRRRPARPRDGHATGSRVAVDGQDDDLVPVAEPPGQAVTAPPPGQPAERLARQEVLRRDAGVTPRVVLARLDALGQDAVVGQDGAVVAAEAERVAVVRADSA